MVDLRSECRGDQEEPMRGEVVILAIVVIGLIVILVRTLRGG